MVHALHIHVCENGIMRPVETVLRKGEEGIKKNEGMGESNQGCCKHFCKYHNVSPVQQ
jgi:hypothetical protein